MENEASHNSNRKGRLFIGMAIGWFGLIASIAPIKSISKPSKNSHVPFELGIYDHIIIVMFGKLNSQKCYSMTMILLLIGFIYILFCGNCYSTILKLLYFSVEKKHTRYLFQTQ